jgi:NADH-quinone oxidoreductase subunit A
MNSLYFPEDYLPVLIQTLIALGFVLITMTLSHFIGGKRKKIRTLHKDENFECGIEIRGNARFPFSIKYFLIAILFVLFDVEVIFLYPFAVDFKNGSWSDFLGILIFLTVFLAGFYYIMRKKAFEWE